ncbi:OmpA family protein [Wohlfahrtiimonas chitiniclastica]|uniref:OmpA family protein n=1 Tax=Wohlfahrtiimonas chitiniclastica TaxID=400946 RepID=A0AB35C1S6_9GAMM|nr:OmpA family protein [Wohlfahrtiimonas chitiniclastica]MBS7824775.1 OmpA family protein [Wohlfahrtiimonas chitiniclastica]MBS7840391.1 OmpA family protein [Wohlfahrtiimonas chitiniclastica]
MKKQLTTLVIAGLVASTSAMAQLEGLVDRQGDFVRDRQGECVLVLDGTPGCGARSVSLSADTFFDFDKAVLKPAGKAELNKLAAQIKQDGAKVRSISLAGYTDGIGSQQYNLGLSERRAKAVEAYLVENGVSPSIITTKGYGKENPIATNETAEGRAKNRRVDVVINGVIGK